MSEIIDQNEDYKDLKIRKIKKVNTFIFALISLIPLYTIWSIHSTHQNLDSPLLPEYTAYYMNAGLINFTYISCLGIVPALYLRFKRKFTFSSITLSLFFIAGLLFKDIVPFYLFFV